MYREDLTYNKTAAYRAKVRLMDPWVDLGLGCSPFLTSNNCVESVSLPHYQDTLDSLEMFVRSEETFAVVSGASGLGKTSILKSFMKCSDLSSSFVEANSSLTGNDLFAKLVFDLSLDIPRNAVGDAAKISLLHDTLSQKVEPILWIIDSAHLLNIGCLNLVLEIITRQRNSSILRVILCGRETLYERLIKQYSYVHSNVRPLHFSVMPLPEHQLKAYLHSCLVKSNWSGALPELSQKILKQIYDLSDGVPHRINMVADKVLYNYLKSQVMPEVSTRPTTVADLRFGENYDLFLNFIISISYLVLICGCYGWYNSVLSGHNFNQSLQSASIPIVGNTMPADVVKKTLDNENPQVAFNNIKSEGVAQSKKTSKLSSNMNNQEFLNYIDNKIKIGPLEKTRMASKILSKKDFKYKLSQAKSLPQHKEDINLFKDKSTLEKWSGYTLQVMASYSLDAIVKFKKNSRLKKNMYIYETVNGYKHWYVLIYANFGTYAEAKKYQEQLNKFHHVNGAWVKSLNSVHYEMRRSLV